MVIPTFWSRLKEGLPCLVHGDGRRVRRMLHVNDVVSAVDLILEKGKKRAHYLYEFNIISFIIILGVPGSIYCATGEKPLTLNQIGKYNKRMKY